MNTKLSGTATASFGVGMVIAAIAMGFYGHVCLPSLLLIAGVIVGVVGIAVLEDT